MTSEIDVSDRPFEELGPLADSPIAPAHGIAAVALTMAVRYHDMSIVKDGTMYQQYKLEGRNMCDINLDTVFETAIKIEAHLLASSERIAKIVVDAIQIAADEDEKSAASLQAEATS